MGERRLRATIHQVGTSLLVDDGLLELKVTEVKSPREVTVTVVHGGLVKARKGVNVPDVLIDCSALPAKVRTRVAHTLR